MESGMTFSRKVTCPYCGSVGRIPAEQFNDDLQCGSCGRAMFAAKPLELTAAAFADTIADSQIPVLVDFWAAWCGPCKMVAPVLDELAEEMGEKVRVAKLNVDENPATPGKFGVRGIPTLILFKEGKVVDQVVGAVPKNQLEGLIKKVL